MKKKIILASATVLFAVATMFNMNMLQGNSVGDVSLESIALMAKASGEGDGNNSGEGDGNNKAEGSKTEKVVTCVEFNYVFFKCSRTKEVTTTVPCCTGGTSTCSASIDC
ncbi:hypothetical protein [Xiashengella succiniciproducens]|jgi:hypothetical protein|uniref:Uncharacterized protein n=1 Tax=Xiashengella succiniciproducens TaxID=2949635 RepID=A0A9J6ZR50_9BACT|nr:hypothetical protein [Alkaliflexus sp. Ai-910]URW80346.1 hypothetical protein M9189_03130 [Alkaliflexus sp. Ai-910]